MESYLNAGHYDLVTPDGIITNLTYTSEDSLEAIVFIEKISPTFVGFQIAKENIFFNIKSTLAQLGVNGIGTEYELDPKRRCAQIKVKLHGIGHIARELLKLIQVGSIIGKLFAADERRRVRDPFYLSRMFGRSDRWGSPLISLGGLHGSTDLILEKINGRTIAYLTLQNGRVEYEDTIYGLLPTIAKGLLVDYPMREILKLHQIWKPMAPHNIEEGKLLLVKTLPLHIRTVFGRVANDLLTKGYQHTSASILQPDTEASGDIYELFGENKRQLTDIPLEFYTLEPYREHIFFEDRDQLKTCIENSEAIFNAFKTAPQTPQTKAAVFVVKGDQLLNLKEDDWIIRTPVVGEFPGPEHGDRQALMVMRYIEQQPSFPFLQAIDNGLITSQGILLSRYFPSPLMKRMLLGHQVQQCLKGIYFQYASQGFGDFFSYEDRSLLHDLNKFGIPIYWVDERTKKILQFIQKPDRDSGLFVPVEDVEDFKKSTVFGIYGSNLIEGEFEQELKELLSGILEMRKEMNHPMLSPKTPISMVTGGGPGAMEVGNRVAKELNILSCANIVDFRQSNDKAVLNEQHQNPYIEAKMTYRIDKLVERQAEFNLDFPIFLCGGIGTDFEFTLEEVRRKVGAVTPTPILLMGTKEYWQEKITSRFQCNRRTGTIKGSEWISNCFYCIENAQQGLHVYREYFKGTLPIGRNGPIQDNGFVAVGTNVFKCTQ